MTKKSKRFFIDVDSITEAGSGSSTAGSKFLSNVPEDRMRVVSVLAEGEGCGIRAGVTASLTATMALRLAENGIELEQIAELLLHSPEKTFIERLESPAFSVVEVQSSGEVEILEFGHPPVHFYRMGNYFPIDRTANELFEDMNKTVYRSSLRCESGDRFVVFTDSFPRRFGGMEKLNAKIREILRNDPDISSRRLVHRVYESSFYSGKMKIDGRTQTPCFTLASLYLRTPRRLLVATGAPYDKEKDSELAGRIANFDGRKAVCGGTTARIIGRELDREPVLDTASAGGNAPPTLTMEGIDLITEGTITLGSIAELLEHGVGSDFLPKTGAERLAVMMLDSDIVRFLVGTRINETHQDPNLPAELDIRRNVVRRIAGILREKYVKEVWVEYV